MKIFKYIILLSFLTTIFYSQKIELVESVPVETTLDNPYIRNTYDVWLELINNALSSIDIEQFYISNEKGKSLDPVINALISAAGRGVEIRLIAEAKFYKIYPETINKFKKINGITVRIIDFEKIAGGVQHAKFFIVDGHKLFLGSQNFDWRAIEHIHEIGVLINDTNFVQTYAGVFELDWELADGKDPVSLMERYKAVRFRNPAFFEMTENGMLIMVPAFSPTGLIPMESLWDKNILEQAIDSSNSDILLQFLSYRTELKDGNKWNDIDSALFKAADRGVNVRLIVSDWSIGKNSINTLKSLNEHDNIEVKFTIIPDWSGGYIPFARVEHCKYIVFDNKVCWIGTSNMERNYFYNSRNVGVLITNEWFVDDLSKIFYKSWNSEYANEIKNNENYEPRFHDEKE